MKRAITTTLLILALIATTLAVIAFGRGYRFNPGQKNLSSTGLLVASSDPTGAQVWLDGNLKTATNNTLALSPGWYQVKITKEGFLSWEKKLRIQGEVVTETQTMLFPSTPSLSPLTTSGVIAPVLSPDGTKIVYAIPLKTGSTNEISVKAGLWVFNLNSQPLGFSRDPLLLAKSSSGLDFAQGIFAWSPDSKQILVSIGANRYLLEGEKTSTAVPLSWDGWKNLLKDWAFLEKEKETEKMILLPPEMAKIATESAKIFAFSPDEKKLLYQATASATLAQFLTPAPIATNSTPEVRTLKPGATYVYDLKEDKNFEIQKDGALLSWFPSSRHLIAVESDKISLMEYDGTNKSTVYNGPFEKFVGPSPSGGKLLVLTSYNRPTGPQISGMANLYSINLR